MHKVAFISSVAGKPTNINVSKTGLSSARVSWTPPSPSPAGYEVFYQAHGGGNRIRRGTTSKTYHDLNGLPLGSHSVFVVAFGAEKDTVLPSAHSDMAIIIIGITVHACLLCHEFIAVSIVCTLQIFHSCHLP